jgi:hypothetical protein
MRPEVKALIFGLIGLAVSQVIAWWQQQSPPAWLAPVLLFVGGAIPLIVDYLKSAQPKEPTAPPQAPRTGPSRTYAYPRPPAPRPARRPGRLVAALLALAVVGGAIAYGGSYVIGWFTGVEPGVQRLAEPVSGSAGALNVHVDEVEVSSHYTRVRLTATNSAAFPVTIPMFGNCQLLEPGQVALPPKTGFVTSTIDVPPGSVPVTTEVVFTGTPRDTATSLSLACSNLFWQGFGQPGSLTVKEIALTGSE